MNTQNMRRLSITAFAGVVIVYLIIVQGAGLLLKPAGIGYGDLPDTDAILGTIVVPVTLSALFAIAVVSYLRWWRPVLHDDKPVQPWVRIVPIVLALTILLTIDYDNLFDRSFGLVLWLLIGTLLVGFTEELMFRGLGVMTFRRAGFTEGRVALWSSLVFGLVHATNIFTEGPKAFLQVIVVSFTGYFLYLSRRASGVIWVPMLLHGFYDFSVFSHLLGFDGELHAQGQALIPLAANILLLIVVLPRLKKVDAPAGTAEPVATG